MKNEKPVVKAENAHYLKGHASWLYCDNCNNTVAYLCYVTYRYFRFSFTCACGSEGWVENRFDDVDLRALEIGKLVQSPANKRYCCEHDESALFSPVLKNLKGYEAEVVCKKCDTRYIAFMQDFSVSNEDSVNFSLNVVCPSAFYYSGAFYFASIFKCQS